MNDVLKLAAVMVVAMACGPGVQAGFAIETVPVGDPGNLGDTRYPGGGVASFGGVAYAYDIGTFEITVGQYVEFLNAVAHDDTYGLYNPSMWSILYGCKIERTGASPDYSYFVEPDWANRPVNYVSWGDAARFANWMHNGQLTGAQDVDSTEDGSYDLSATQSYYGPGGETPEYGSDDYYALNAALAAVVRKPDATWVIPSEDEWYKAAYYDASGVFYDYATSSDSVPSNDLIDPDPGNNATFYAGGGDYTIGTPYARTEVGAHENSDSPYGTFDQTGNVTEWNEAVVGGSDRGLRGGSFFSPYDSLLFAAARAGYAPTGEDAAVGFRVAEVERAAVPAMSEWGLAAMALLLLIAGTHVCARRRAAMA